MRSAAAILWLVSIASTGGAGAPTGPCRPEKFAPAGKNVRGQRIGFDNVLAPEAGKTVPAAADFNQDGVLDLRRVRQVRVERADDLDQPADVRRGVGKDDGIAARVRGTPAQDDIIKKILVSRGQWDPLYSSANLQTPKTPCGDQPPRGEKNTTAKGAASTNFNSRMASSTRVYHQALGS